MSIQSRLTRFISLSPQIYEHNADLRPIDGEFHVDLYTLPDALIKMLWDYTEKRVDMSVLA